jgi:MbtH protein
VSRHPLDDEDGRFLVVVNEEEQYALWPEPSRVPLGWRTVAESGSRREALEYIERNWTDMRPASLRRSAAAEGAAP